MNDWWILDVISMLATAHVASVNFALLRAKNLKSEINVLSVKFYVCSIFLSLNPPLKHLCRSVQPVRTWQSLSEEALITRAVKVCRCRRVKCCWDVLGTGNRQNWNQAELQQPGVLRRRSLLQFSELSESEKKLNKTHTHTQTQLTLFLFWQLFFFLALMRKVFFLQQLWICACGSI